MNREQPLGIAVRCPVCSERNIATASEVKVVRGMLFVTRYGSYTAIGCPPCVAGEVRGELLRNLFLGWWSVHGLLFTPLALLHNAANSFPRHSERRLAAALESVGIDIDDLRQGQDGLSNEHRRLLRAAGAGIAAVAEADGRSAAEWSAAVRAIISLSDDKLTSTQAEAILEQNRHARIAIEHLDVEQRYVVFQIAVLVAVADEQLSPAEYRELSTLARELELPIEVLDEFLRPRSYKSNAANDPRARAAKLLGVEANASIGEIRAAWKRLAFVSHPDRVPPHEREEATAKMAAINDAYDLLLSGGRR